MKKQTGVSLDMRMTGQILKQAIRKQGYTVSEIQNELGLSCPQPIYRWFRGEAMPSIDNLYRLSTILKVHMDELLLPRQDEVWIIQRMQNLCQGRRLKRYHSTYFQKGR